MIAETRHSLGPIRLSRGVKPRHVCAYLFAAFISIGMFTYLIALTPYVLRVNLGVSESDLGRVSGDLQFWQEIALLVLGFLIATIGYAWAASLNDILSLSALPALFCMGMGLSSAQLSSTVLLAQEAEPRIRGSAYGLQALCGGLGILALSAGGGRLYDSVGPQAPFVAVAIANFVVLACAVAHRLMELKTRIL